MPLTDAGRNVRAVVQWDDTCVVNGLHPNRDVVLGLEDLDVAVVAGANPRSTETDAPLTQSTILPRVSLTRIEDALAGPPSRRSRRSVGAFLGQRRNSSVGWIRNERRPAIEVSIDEPELVVVPGLAVLRHERLRLGQRGVEYAISKCGVATAVKELGRCRLERDELFIGQCGLPLERLGPL